VHADEIPGVTEARHRRQGPVCKVHVALVAIPAGILLLVWVAFQALRHGHGHSRHARSFAQANMAAVAVVIDTFHVLCM
jgi:hypothetical protein